MNKQDRHAHLLNFYWLLLVIAYAIAHAVFAGPEHSGVFKDDGFFSFLTIVLASGGLILIVRTGIEAQSRKFKLHLFLIAYVFLIYILRECDFHRLFTPEHITRFKYYTNPEFALAPKIVAAAVMLIFIHAASYLLIYQTPLILFHLKLFQPWAIALALWGSLLFVSQVIDKSDANRTFYGEIAEEMLEVCAAGYALLAARFGTSRLKRITVMERDKTKWLVQQSEPE